MIMLMTAVFKNHLLNRNVTPLWLLRGLLVALSFFILSVRVAHRPSRPQDASALQEMQSHAWIRFKTVAFMLQVCPERIELSQLRQHFHWNSIG